LTLHVVVFTKVRDAYCVVIKRLLNLVGAPVVFDQIQYLCLFWWKSRFQITPSRKGLSWVENWRIWLPSRHLFAWLL